MHTQVIAKIPIEGFHFYPKAPHKVAFLEHKHRHTFFVTAAYDVTHNNREIEIFIARAKIAKHLDSLFGTPCDFENMSCEHIAEAVLDNGKADGMCWVEVWEEDTGGARITI